MREREASAAGLEIVAFRSEAVKPRPEGPTDESLSDAVRDPSLQPRATRASWLMAALIFIALPLGVWASELPCGEMRSEILFVHKSIGMTVLCLVALRIV